MAYSDKQTFYVAYLIRLWRVDDFNRPVWRMMLENVHSANRHYFNRLEDLILFLEKQTQSQNDQKNPLD